MKLNQLVELVVEENEASTVYRSRVEEVTEKYTLLAMPNFKGLPILLSPGTQVLVRLILEGGVYQFHTLYIDRQYVPIPVWIVGPPFDVKRIQRRAFYRLDTHLPVALHLKENSNQDANESGTMNLYSKDLSGGGIRVVSKEQLAVGTEVAIELLLPDRVIVPTQGRVVRLESAAPDSSIYWVSVEFTDIDEHDRKKIIRFVFLKQLEQR